MPPWLILISFGLSLSAQQPFSNLRTRIIDARLPLQQLDSLTVAAPLLSVFDAVSGQAVDLSFFSLENNYLKIDTGRFKPTNSRLYVNYRVLPQNLAAPVQRLDTAAIRRAGAGNDIEFDYTPYEPPSKPWESAGLVSNGAYTRGLSFGNNQNLAFNSNLNLQLGGRLGNDLEIQAALSDNSIPLQPDGTTRQLQEFDRIFVQLKRKNLSLTAGDFDLTRPQVSGYFTNYFKRLQGAMVIADYGLSRGLGTDYGLRIGPDSAQTQVVPATAPGSTDNSAIRNPQSVPRPRDNPQSTIRLAAAISRGKFARQIVAGQEGNQGPYRLLGAEGERFIIVLAGTEKVFLDGLLLRRGLDDDYIIDYNLGEVTFTPRRLISKDSRIIIEFEYAVQTYLRSTLAANASWQGRKSLFYFNAYSEQDSRNAGGAQELSAAERGRLAQAGDNLQDAYASGIDTLEGEFDRGRVLYKSADTLVCGILTPVLVYSTNPDSARYAARFTEVPAGQGNYVQVQTAANGRVFRWVAPDPLTCQPSGNFEPVVRLIAPESRQLFTAGTETQLSKSTLVQAEIAVSNRDLNRFSPLGNDDNTGLGGFFSLRQNLFPSGAAKGWQLQLNGTYEFAGRQFVPLNPYRPAEFVRDWNIGTAEKPAAEHWARSGFSLQKKEWGNARYEFGAFLREGLYDGFRHTAQGRFQRRGFDLLAEINLLQTNGTAENSRFSRPKFDLGKTFFRKDKKPLFKIGFYGERERNERRPANADTLNRASFWYDLTRLYWQTPETQGAWQWGAAWMRRNDFVPLGQSFRQNTSVDETNLNGRTPPTGKWGTLAWNLSWRQLRIIDPELTTLDPQQTYLGRLDYTLNAWKNALAFTAGYELGSGQSPRLEFSYVRVNPGEGQYAWVDRNRDSILQVDEMEIAVFQDQAEYIRVAVTTTDYLRTNNTTLNQSLRLDPRLVWGQSKKRWRRLMSRLSTQSNLQISRRVLASARGEPAWNPFDLAVADTALVAVSATLRNALYVNRADPAWDASLAWSDNRGRNALTTGFESRRLGDWTLHGRVNFSRHWSGELDLSRGKKVNDSQTFNARDYDILFWRVAPKLSWLPTRTFRLIASYAWRDSRNTLPSAESARQTDWSAEMSWNPQGKPNDAGFRAVTSIRTRATYARISYSGAANSAVAYAMLDGLQDGRNFLWSINVDRQLSRSVQLSLNYEGRKTGENRMVHVGRAQVRAVF
ncbi:MAG: hypothetical protein L6Q97_03300 [Thermoanaerobaculia bacterium]|nr:hypothetical protein [Thermoanaerobaculia bacterium]